jgi:hypothetical protein
MRNITYALHMNESMTLSRVSEIEILITAAMK